MLAPRGPESVIEAPSGENFVMAALPGNVSIFICQQKGSGYLASYNHSQRLAMTMGGSLTTTGHPEAPTYVDFGSYAMGSAHRDRLPQDLSDPEAVAAMILPIAEVDPAIKEAVTACLRDNADTIFSDTGGTWEVGKDALMAGGALTARIRQMAFSV